MAAIMVAFSLEIFRSVAVIHGSTLAAVLSISAYCSMSNISDFLILVGKASGYARETILESSRFLGAGALKDPNELLDPELLDPLEFWEETRVNHENRY